MKIFIISLVIIFCFFFSYSASAQTTNATPAQTTNPTPASPPTITGYNDTSTIVIDYKHPVLNQIPIDRPFNIMVTGIDTSLKKIHLNFYQIETRPVPERKFTSASADGSYYEKIKTSGNGKNKRKTRHRNSLPAGPISSEDLKKFTIKKVIPCGGGNVAQGQTNFVPVQQFHPNRNYIFDLSSDSSTLNQTQQADLRNYLKGQFATDTTLKKIIYSVESHYYQKRSDAFVGFAAANDKIKRQIKTIMNSKYPNYNFYYNFKYTSGFRHIVEIASIAGKIRDIDTVLMICDTSVLHSSNKGDTIFISKADSLINAIDTTFKKLDWVSLIDTASVNSIKKLFANKYFDTIRNDTVLRGSSRNDSTMKSRYLKIYNDIRDILTSIDKVSDTMNANIDNFIQHTIIESTYSITLSTSYYLNITQNAKTNITLDIGGGYSSSMDQMFGYWAIDIYFRPIDKNLPLWNTNYKFLDFLGSRVSFLAGLTLTPIDETGVRKGIVGNKGIITGAGFRLLPWLKVNGGGLIYYGRNTNPLVTSYTM